MEEATGELRPLPLRADAPHPVEEGALLDRTKKGRHDPCPVLLSVTGNNFTQDYKVCHFRL